MVATDVLHKVQLVDGEFTTSEASDLIKTLIDVKLNFHKLHRIALCEGNMHMDTSFDDSRVHELLQEKDDFAAFIREAKQAGKKIRINGILDVELID